MSATFGGTAGFTNEVESCEQWEVVTLRILLSAAIAFSVLAGAGCAQRQPAPASHVSALVVYDAHKRLLDERKDEVIKQIAICESGGYGPSEKPIYGGRGAYIGRLQFATHTVMNYVQRRDGVQLNPKQAAELAHDYDKAAELAKYMIFDLEEPWHWPVCSKKLGVPAQIRAIKES